MQQNPERALPQAPKQTSENQLRQIDPELIKKGTTDDFDQELTNIKDPKLVEMYLKLLSRFLREHPNRMINSLKELDYLVPPPFKREKIAETLILNVPNLGRVRITMEAYNAYLQLPSPERVLFVKKLRTLIAEDPKAIITDVQEVIVGENQPDKSALPSSVRTPTTAHAAISVAKVAEAMKAPSSVNPLEVDDDEVTRSLQDEIKQQTATSSTDADLLSQARARFLSSTTPRQTGEKPRPAVEGNP